MLLTLCCFIIYILALRLYKTYSCRMYMFPFISIHLSLIGHLVCSYAYSFVDSDSQLIFYRLRTSNFSGLGTNLVKNMVWFVDQYIANHSYVGVFIFFGMCAFLGGVAWFAVFLKLCQKLSLSGRASFLSPLIIMCWPSGLYFTSGLGKDSLVYMFIPLLLLSGEKVVDKKVGVCKFFSIILCSVVLISVRPYMAIVFLFSVFLCRFSLQRKNCIRSFFATSIALVTFILVAVIVIRYQGGIEAINFNALNEKAISQRYAQSVGTHFDFPLNVHGAGTLVFLPYSFIMNAFFPLFYFAHGAIGIIASIENAVLVYLTVVICLNYRLLFCMLRESMVKMLFCLFISGISFMSVLNTNLGLATRQKQVYLPCMLIIFSLIYIYRRKSIIYLRKTGV